MFGFKDSIRYVRGGYNQLGLKKDVKDKRDFVNVGASIKERHDLKPYSSFVKDQGSMNSCTAHAAMLVFEMEQRINNKRWQIEGSEQHNYYNSRIMCGLFPADKGSYLRHTCKAMHQLGVCPEKLMPYIDGKPNYEPGIFTNSFAKFWKIKSYIRQLDIEAIKNSIEADHPVLLGVPIYNNWIGLKVKDIPLPDGTTIGGHAIVIIGFDDAQQSFHIQNSWGTGWGKYGLAWLPYKYFEEVSWFDAWSIRL